MQPQNYVNFKKERDLGAIITDSFKFIRLEWKPFFLTILKASILPIIISIGAFGYYLWSVFSFGANTNLIDENVFDFFGSMLIAVVVLMISAMVTYVFMQLSSLHFIKQYVQNQGRVDYSSVMEGVKNDFWSMFGLVILIVITAIISIFLCVLPILYVWPIITLIPVIYVFGNKSALDSFGFSFSLVGGRHWPSTFGVMFVISLLVGVLSYVFTIPQLAYQLIKTFSIIEDNNPEEIFSIFKDPIYLFLLFFGYLGRFFLYTITQVTNVFIYFDIDEQENASGTIDTIESIGE